MEKIEDNESFRADVFKVNGKFVAEVALVDRLIDYKMTGYGDTAEEAIRNGLDKCGQLLSDLFK